MTVHDPGAAARQTAPDTLGAMIAEALGAAPERCAFRFRGTGRSRGEILAAAHHLAARLQEQGLAPGEPVAIEVAHSFELVIGMCGVLLAGGCAVPVDPGTSEDRRRAILEDIAPRLILERTDETAAEGPSDRIRIRSLDRPPPAPNPALAFIVYTSGSSGGPKGVEITHEGYTKRLRHIVSPKTGPTTDVDLLWTPSSFIGLLDEIFFPMFSGIPAVIAAPSERSDPRAFADLVARERITAFRITPSLLGVFLGAGIADRLVSVRSIFCSGETLPEDVQRKAHALLGADIIGFYGATEAPGVAFHAYDRDAPPLRTTVCTPQDFATFRILRADGSEADTDEPGEIRVGGDAVANGYWKKPDLTAEKFVTADGLRWYVTGDQGRRLADGRIEILGRTDMSEVNIHGVRISLSEIRAKLRELPGVADAWVSVVAPETGGDPALVGHCVTAGAEGFDAQACRKALSTRLPALAVPRTLMRHDAFPLTANGKLDIQRLARDAAGHLAAGGSPEDARPGDAGEISAEAALLLPTVIETAENVLRKQGLGPRDNFFAVGGNSLLAVQFSLAMSERLGIDLITTLVFNTDCLADIAEAIAEGRVHAAASLKPLRAGAAAEGGRHDGETEPAVFTINATANYTLLAQHLGGTYPVYNANIFGLTNDLIDRLDSFTLEDLARRLAAQILEAHPEGPWRLLAYCQDGCLAIEIARILQAERGGSGCGLLLIDTFFTEHRPSPWMLAVRAVDFGLSYYLRKFRNRGRKRDETEAFAEIPAERRAALMGKAQNDKRLYQRYTELFMGYRPAPYDGPVSLFVSREWRHANLSSVREMAGDRLEVHFVPGLHNQLFTPETVPGIAAAVDAALPHLARHGA